MMLGVNLFQMGISDFFFRAESKMRKGGSTAVPPAWADVKERKEWEKGKRYARRQLA